MIKRIKLFLERKAAIKKIILMSEAWESFFELGAISAKEDLENIFYNYLVENKKLLCNESTLDVLKNKINLRWVITGPDAGEGYYSKKENSILLNYQKIEELLVKLAIENTHQKIKRSLK